MTSLIFWLIGLIIGALFSEAFRDYIWSPRLKPFIDRLPRRISEYLYVTGEPRFLKSRARREMWEFDDGEYVIGFWTIFVPYLLTGTFIAIYPITLITIVLLSIIGIIVGLDPLWPWILPLPLAFIAFVLLNRRANDYADARARRFEKHRAASESKLRASGYIPGINPYLLDDD